MTRQPTTVQDRDVSRHPSFPPDVAAALQQPAGTASVRYTVSAALADGPQVDTVLMETPYESVLAARCHWHIDMTWDDDQLRVEVRDQNARSGPQLEGRWPTR